MLICLSYLRNKIANCTIQAIQRQRACDIGMYRENYIHFFVVIQTFFRANT